MRQGSAGTVGVTARGGIGRLPKEGTLLRNWYDAFLASPGVPIEFSVGGANKYGSNVINQLSDMYGLVIRKTSNPGERVLVARHLGKEYVEYEVKNGKAID